MCLQWLMGLTYGILMWGLLETSLVAVAGGLKVLAPLSFPAMFLFMLAVAGTLGMTFRTVHYLLLGPMLMMDNDAPPTAPKPLAMLHADFGNGTTLSSAVHDERAGDVGKAPASVLAHIFALAAKSSPSSSTSEPASVEQPAQAAANDSSAPCQPDQCHQAPTKTDRSSTPSACSDRSRAETEEVFETPSPAASCEAGDPNKKP